MKNLDKNMMTNNNMCFEQFRKKSFFVFIVIQIDKEIKLLIKLRLIGNFKFHSILFYHYFPLILNNHDNFNEINYFNTLKSY